MFLLSKHEPFPEGLSRKPTGNIHGFSCSSGAQGSRVFISFRLELKSHNMKPTETNSPPKLAPQSDSHTAQPPPGQGRLDPSAAGEPREPPGRGTQRLSAGACQSISVVHPRNSHTVGTATAVLLLPRVTKGSHFPCTPVGASYGSSVPNPYLFGFIKDTFPEWAVCAGSWTGETSQVSLPSGSPW